MLESGLEPYIEDAIDPSIKVNGLPEKGAPSAAEDTDASAASLGPWNKVADEASPLTALSDSSTGRTVMPTCAWWLPAKPTP